jgi:hypothetical protein
MQLTQARCTVCGASLKLNIEKTTVECRFCHNVVIVEQALDFEKVEADKTSDIKRLRINLEKYVGLNAVEEILKNTNLILDILPNDFIANYYFSYAKRVQGEPKFIEDFYGLNYKYTDDSLIKVIGHIINNSDLRDKTKVIDFLEVVAPYEVNRFLEIYVKRQSMEENYSNIKRDIFICFSSENINVAKEVLSNLEEEGYSCWISIRNLRPNDPSNYWKSIESAIDNSSSLLVISSEEAMISKDVQKEITYASKNKKTLIEYKIDKSPHTSLFKYTFNGITWIDGFSDKSGIKKLIERLAVDVKKRQQTIKFKINFKVKPLLYIFATIAFVSALIFISLNFYNSNNASNSNFLSSNQTGAVNSEQLQIKSQLSDLSRVVANDTLVFEVINSNTSNVEWYINNLKVRTGTSSFSYIFTVNGDYSVIAKQGNRQSNVLKLTVFNGVEGYSGYNNVNKFVFASIVRPIVSGFSNKTIFAMTDIYKTEDTQFILDLNNFIGSTKEGWIWYSANHSIINLFGNYILGSTNNESTYNFGVTVISQETNRTISQIALNLIPEINQINNDGIFFIKKDNKYLLLIRSLNKPYKDFFKETLENEVNDFVLIGDFITG